MNLHFDPTSYLSWIILFLLFFGVGLIVRDVA